MPHTSRVSNTKRLTAREAPRWFIVVTAIAGLTILAYFGCQAVMGREGEPGPRMKVYPHMYDLQAEVAKMRAAHQAGRAPNGP